MVAVARAERARPVAVADTPDLDHVGAVLGEQHGAIGAGDALAEVDHLQAGERRVVAHASLTSILPKFSPRSMPMKARGALSIPLDDVLAVLELAALDPLAHLSACRCIAFGEVGDDEAARRHALADEGAHQARSHRRWWRCIARSSRTGRCGRTY